MFSTITELFLSTYFLFDALAGRLVCDTRLIFDKLYEAFCLPSDKKDELFNATQARVVLDVKTYADYAQICRIQRFSALSGTDNIPGEYSELIVVKGDALKKLKLAGFDEYMGGTETAAGKLLNDTANMGYLSSLCALGFLQCEGLYVSRNVKLGIKNLEKAAQWNSVEGILLALYYNPDNRQTNINRLYTATTGTLYESIVEPVRAFYNLDGAVSIPENRLLKKAFGAGILKPELQVPQYARFIFSDVIIFKDRERVLFSSQKEAISETADLPLKLTCGELKFDAQPLLGLPIARSRENKRIASLAKSSDMRRDPSYNPLCIACDSEYVLSLYMSAMSKAFNGAHVEKIDVADLNDYDFEPTKHNIFVRSCEEDKQNVYFLVFKGDVREGVFNLTKSFLQTDKRKKFKLQHPGATIDLSAVLPVCFCDTQNAQFLKPYCDMITIASLSEAEKVDLFEYIVQGKAAKYKIGSLQVDRSARNRLLSYSIERAENILDRAIRYNRSGDELVIDVELIREIECGDIGAKTKYGFGGAAIWK